MKERVYSHVSGLLPRLVGAFVLFALCLVMIPGILYYNLSGNISSIEMTQLKEGRQQLEQAAANLGTQLLRNTQDYAHWDDMVKAVQANDDLWFQDQVKDYALRHYGYAYVAFADVDGHVRWQSDSAAGFGDDLARTSYFVSARSGNEWQGLISTNQGLVELASANVIPLASENSDHAVSDSVGVLIFGKLVGIDFVRSLSSSTGLDVAIFDRGALIASSEALRTPPVGTAFLAVDGEAQRSVLSKQSFVHTTSMMLYQYDPILSSAGDVVGAIRIGQSRATTNFVRNELLRSVLLLFLVSILLLLVLAWLLGKWFISPIVRLSVAMRNFGKNGKVVEQDIGRRNDEIGELHRAFSEVVKQLDVKQDELLARDRELRSTNRKLEANAVALNQAKETVESKLEEISKLNRFMVGREVRMAELKRELKEKSDN